MKTSQSHPHHPRHVHAPLIAAATAPVHDAPHATEAAPGTGDLSDEQKAYVKTLGFLSDYEIAHLRKASPDVATAFDANALATIENHAELGGPTRAAAIRALIDQHQQLAAIAAIVAPLARLVGQNLMSVDSQLAQNAGEPLRVAHSLHRSVPALLEGLDALDAWSHEHHGRPSAHPPAPPASPPSAA